MSKTHYIIPVFVPALGCPHRCIFCNQQKITGQAAVPTPIEVEKNIAAYLRTIPAKPHLIKEVAFYGGSFTSIDRNLQQELLTPAYQSLVKGEIDRIRVSARPDAVSEETMAFLTSYGVSTVELGVQSMDDEVLRQAGRGHTRADVLRAAAVVKARGANLGFQMMIGLPGDTWLKDISSASELIGLKPDLVRIYPCLVLKDTGLAELYRQGKYVPLTLDETVELGKKLLVMFTGAGINVIRIGLQPSEQINLNSDVLAGPYHPALRELVETAVARDQLTYLFEKKARLRTAHTVKIAVPPEDVSFVRGHKRSNVDYFKQKYGLTRFVTMPDPELPRGTIKLVGIDEKEADYTVSRADLLAC